LPQEAIHQSGFAVVYVGNNRDVAECFHNHSELVKIRGCVSARGVYTSIGKLVQYQIAKLAKQTCCPGTR
jgi:hypothetical protein